MNYASHAQELQAFFNILDELCTWYQHLTGKKPDILRINPAVLQKLSKLEGFFQRPELGAEVTQYAPLVRYLNLPIGIVTIQEDWTIPFLSFDGQYE